MIINDNLHIDINMCQSDNLSIIDLKFNETDDNIDVSFRVSKKQDMKLYYNSIKNLLNNFEKLYNNSSVGYKIIPINEKYDVDNILEIKRQIDSIFNKYIPPSNENVIENTEGLDLELMDKITPLVPEGKEILLKNIVKEINGSAKGLSDFVIMFTKYRQSIINHNSIDYFQRKGCHFLRKI
jgi:hypothetical protein